VVEGLGSLKKNITGIIPFQSVNGLSLYKEEIEILPSLEKSLCCKSLWNGK